MTHTPGPWNIGGKYGHLKDEILALNGSKAIATVWTREFDERNDARHMATVPNPEGKANARLIAAAPELLEKLADLLNACDKQMFNGGITSETMTAMEQARAVIVKLMGE